MAAEINKGKEAQAAIPSEEISRLFEVIIGNIEVVLLVFAVMIVLVAGIGIMVSIYNSMNDRRHEIAIMRALGARRSTVMMVILLESILLSLGGGLLGLGLGHGLLAIAGPWIAEKVNLPLSMLDFRAVELILIPGLIALASIVGLPARRGRLPHRRGQVVDRQPVSGYNGWNLRRQRGVSRVGRVKQSTSFLMVGLVSLGPPYFPNLPPTPSRHHYRGRGQFQFADDRRAKTITPDFAVPGSPRAWRPRIAAAIS